MTRAFRIRPVTRRRLAWLVALMLLWQQVAVAAYACETLPGTMEQRTAMTSPASTGAMDDGCADMHGTSATPLCQKHCAPDHATQVDARPVSVPLSALVAVPPMLMSVTLAARQSDRSLARLDHRRISPAIPRLLFCSLLI